jgi:L-seryl-tRNA(Ser) seleniumtransferase
MLSLGVDDIDARAEALAAALPPSLGVEIIDGHSAIGGGSAPDVELPTRLIAVVHPSKSANDIEAELRGGATPIIARIEDGRVLLDLRTVTPDDDTTIVKVLGAMC